MNKVLRKVLFTLIIITFMFFGINVYAEEEISDIAVTGIKKPGITQKVSANIANIKVPDNANYTIDEVVWWCDDNNDGVYGPMDENDQFVGYSNWFYYEIILKPKEGFKFSTTIDSESGYEEFSGSVSTSNMSYEDVSYNYYTDSTGSYYDGTLSIWGKAFCFGYFFTKGSNQKVLANKAAEFEIDADYSLFEDGGKVYIDNADTPLDSSNYTSRSGSTIISLNKEYVNTLSEGEHTLTVVFNDENIATTTFTVSKDVVNDKTGNSNVEILPPNTGIDNSLSNNTLLFKLFLILSITGFFGTIIITKKKSN